MSLRLVAVGARKLEREYDLVIIGGGPAGLSAAIYAARFGTKCILITDRIGGLLNEAGVIDDYPGLPGVRASALIDSLSNHVRKYGVPILVDKVTAMRPAGGLYEVFTEASGSTRSRAVILAVGTKRRRLGVPGEAELEGKGVSYCSVCDAPLFKGAKAVAVVGGGNSALEGALILSNYVERVYLIHRRASFRAMPYYVTLVESNPKVVKLMNHIVVEIKGDTTVKSVVLRDLKSGGTKEISVNGVFIEIGFEPRRELLARMGVELDDEGFIKVNDKMETNLPGVFAAGDCTNMWKDFRQVVTAAAMGAVAAYSAYNYLLKAKGLEGSHAAP